MEDDFKLCAGCGSKKAMACFHIDRRSVDGRYYKCKECVKLRPKIIITEGRRAAKRRYRAGQGGRPWERYGIPLRQYNFLRSEQVGGCAICGAEKSWNGTKLAIDHDHKTKIVRGFLCAYCNRAIGLMRENPVIIEKASAYLRNPPLARLSVFVRRERNDKKS